MIAAGVDVVSPDPSVRWRIGAGGSIQRSDDGGARWAAQASGVAQDLIAGSSPQRGVCWVVGRAGTVLLLSELASNLAVATMTMPIAAALGHSVGQSPAVMMLVAGFAASTGFALPIATPPNAIVFGSGMVSVRQMARAGVLLDIISVFIIALAVALLAPLVLAL